MQEGSGIFLGKLWQVKHEKYLCEIREFRHSPPDGTSLHKKLLSHVFKSYRILHNLYLFLLISNLQELSNHILLDVGYEADATVTLLFLFSPVRIVRFGSARNR